MQCMIQPTDQQYKLCLSCNKPIQLSVLLSLSQHNIESVMSDTSDAIILTLLLPVYLFLF